MSTDPIFFWKGDCVIALQKNTMIDVRYPSCEEYEACLHTGRDIPVYATWLWSRRIVSQFAKAVASTALGVASDLMRGIPLSRAIRTRGLAAGKEFLLNSVKKSPSKSAKRRDRPPTKRIRKYDVFGAI